MILIVVRAVARMHVVQQPHGVEIGAGLHPARCIVGLDGACADLGDQKDLVEVLVAVVIVRNLQAAGQPGGVQRHAELLPEEGVIGISLLGRGRSHPLGIDATCIGPVTFDEGLARRFPGAVVEVDRARVSVPAGSHVRVVGRWNDLQAAVGERSRDDDAARAALRREGRRGLCRRAGLLGQCNQDRHAAGCARRHRAHITGDDAAALSAAGREGADIGRASRQWVADDHVGGCYRAAVDVAQHERELVAPIGRRVRAADLLFQHDVRRRHGVAVIRSVVRGVRICAMRVIIADHGAVCHHGALRGRAVHVDIEGQRALGAHRHRADAPGDGSVGCVVGAGRAAGAGDIRDVGWQGVHHGDAGRPRVADILIGELIGQPRLSCLQRRSVIGLADRKIGRAGDQVNVGDLVVGDVSLGAGRADGCLVPHGCRAGGQGVLHLDAHREYERAVGRDGVRQGVGANRRTIGVIHDGRRQPRRVADEEKQVPIQNVHHLDALSRHSADVAHRDCVIQVLIGRGRGLAVRLSNPQVGGAEHHILRV